MTHYYFVALFKVTKVAQRQQYEHPARNEQMCETTVSIALEFFS